jgi:hypothetical protein
MYNGTTGHVYNFRNRNYALGAPILVFTSNQTNTASTQAKTLQVLATDKLPGLDSTSIVNASWTDITNRFTLSTGAGAIGPDTVGIGDLVSSAEDSLFLAFKYTGATGTPQPTWSITSYSVVNMLPQSGDYPPFNYTVSNLSGDASYWTKLLIAPSAAGWNASTSSLSITGGATTAPNNVAWIVSKPLYLGLVPPDVPSQIVQNINSATQFGPFTPSTPKPYTLAGTYKVTFLYFNDSIDDQKSDTTTIYIKVQ